MRKPWGLWGKFKPILDFFSLQERSVSPRPLGENTASCYTFFPNAMQSKYSDSHGSFHKNSLYVFCGKNTEKESLIRKFGVKRRQNQKHRGKTLFLKWNIQIPSNPGLQPLGSTCSSLAGLSGTDWVPLELESKSSPLTVTFTAFQLSHQSVRHNTFPSLGI